jgi:hypothetical protein
MESRGVTNQKTRKLIPEGWHRPLLIITSSRYGTPYNTGTRGSHEMATAKNWKMKKRKCTRTGATRNRNNRYMTGRFYINIFNEPLTIGRWQEVTESRGLTPERHCRQWHPNSLYSAELFLNIWYRFQRMMPIWMFFSWIKHCIWNYGNVNTTW